MSNAPPARVPRIGLTGGIASGKSTVADYFGNRGAPIIDTDVIARQVVAAGEPALEEIVARFGDAVLQDDGSLDRGVMRRIVFADDAKRRDLEAILHPRIRDATLKLAESAGGAYQIIVVPLLVESPMRHGMDRIVVVDVPVTVQLERLMQRDAENREQAERMIAAQVSRQQRLAIADDVIDNAGTLTETQRQVDALHRKYLRMGDAA